MSKSNVQGTILGITIVIFVSFLAWKYSSLIPFPTWVLNVLNPNKVIESFVESRLPPGTKRMLTIYKVDWCPHCKRLTQPVDKLQELLSEQPLPSSRLEVVDCEKDPRACREAGVRSYPTLHLEEEGKKDPIVVPKTVDRENARELYLLLRNGL